MDWDEHTAWIALLDDDADADDNADRARIVDRLAPAFAAHHRQGKDYLKHALVPIAEHTKQIHDAIRAGFFPRRTHAVALLNNAALAFENAARRDTLAANTAYTDTKRDLDALFADLDDLVRQSDALFHAFKSTMLDHVQRLRRCTDQITPDADRLVASLDKRAKHLGAQDHAKAKENLLRGILEKY